MIARAFREADPSRYPVAQADAFRIRDRINDALIIRNDLREVLGRDPTQAEIDQYVSEVAQ
jgi:hypothetical protein